MTKMIDLSDGSECRDCNRTINEHHEHYSVKNSLWSQAGMNEGYLCIGCLEKRLGRRLSAIDFTSAPVNWLPIFLRSDRLMDRMGNKTLTEDIQKLVDNFYSN